MFKFKKFLNKSTFFNLVDSEKIWNKKLPPEKILKLLEELEENINKYKFKKDKNFIMTERRIVLKEMITDRLKKTNDYNEILVESLFNFWEFVNDEYIGNLFTISEKTNIDIKKLEAMAIKYKNKNIICLEEKEQILEIICELKNYINKKRI